MILGEDVDKNIDVVNKLHILTQDALDDYLKYPDVNVEESAKLEYSNYLHCPSCHNIWESTAKTPMVICPICEIVLHNPLHRIF